MFYATDKEKEDGYKLVKEKKKGLEKESLFIAILYFGSGFFLLYFIFPFFFSFFFLFLFYFLRIKKRVLLRRLYIVRHFACTSA